MLSDAPASHIYIYICISYIYKHIYVYVWLRATPVAEREVKGEREHGHLRGVGEFALCARKRDTLSAQEGC